MKESSHGVYTHTHTHTHTHIYIYIYGGIIPAFRYKHTDSHKPLKPRIKPGTSKIRSKCVSYFCLVRIIFVTKLCVNQII